MSSRIFQNVIIQMKDAIDRTIGVVDDQGFIIACSELSMIGSRLDEFHVYEMEASEQPVSIGSRTFCPEKCPADHIFQCRFRHKTIRRNFTFAGFITVKTIITAHVAEAGGWF